MASRDIVAYSDVALLVPHAVSMIYLNKRLLEMSNTTVKHPVLKPATLLPTPDGTQHNCVAVPNRFACQETPFSKPDLVH